MEDPFDPQPERTLAGSGTGTPQGTPSRTKQLSSQPRLGGGSTRKQGGVCRLFNGAPAGRSYGDQCILSIAVLTMAGGTVQKRAGAQDHKDTGRKQATGPYCVIC